MEIFDWSHTYGSAISETTVGYKGRPGICTVSTTQHVRQSFREHCHLGLIYCVPRHSSFHPPKTVCSMESFGWQFCNLISPTLNHAWKAEGHRPLLDKELV